MTPLGFVAVALAGLMGAAGVALAAAGAHLADGARLSAASSILLFHAPAIVAATLLAPALGRGALGCAFGLALGAMLFAGDLSLRHVSGHGLFPMAAPTGGLIMIASWLALGALAAWRAF